MITFETQEEFEKAVLEVMRNSLALCTEEISGWRGQDSYWISLVVNGKQTCSDSIPIRGCRCGDTY